MAMEYIAGTTQFKLKNTAVTFGKFDGLHLGHRRLLDLTVKFKEQGLAAVVFTFLMHPGNLLNDKEIELIYTEEEKKAILERLGIDIMISYPFTQETRNTEPEDFIRQVIYEKLGAKMIVVGEDFCFGKNRRGNVAMLKQYEKEYGYTVIACSKLKLNDEIISSSVIRSLLNEGNIEAANRMLGQAYSIQGEVVHGRKLGRTIGIPTVNIVPADNKLLPPCGVYASKIKACGKEYMGVTNIGYKPTIGDDEPIGIETNIFDIDMELYGKTIEVELISYIRPELKFDSLEDLIARMNEDILVAKSILNYHPNIL